ncbi:MAG: helix-turn-helix transcriptional regulator [Clostridia bacterium]|nr:helix-turn-helix transcriptional regulator [Clostridia bacterium]
MTIGEKIKELRIEKELSQTALSKSIGVSQKAIDYWERGVNEPKASYIMALVQFFELSYNEFFEDIQISDKK